MNKWEYYWYCSLCKIKEQPANSLDNAKEQLEKHEVEKHKKKSVGTVGMKKI